MIPMPTEQPNYGPYMIQMSDERLNCVTLCLSNTLFIYVLKLHNHGVCCCCKTSCREQIIQNNVKAIKELEKGTPHKGVASLFGVPKNTLSTWKKNKDKIFEKYNSDLISKRVKQKKYEELNKAVHK